MKLYIVRHGQTDWNSKGIIQGRTDIVLNDTGRQQALMTNAQLNGITFDCIYCSPLNRTKETAEIINRNRNLPIIYDERLLERNFGAYEGTYVKDLDFSQFWRLDQVDNQHSEEKASDFFIRVHHFLSDIIKLDYDNVLIVTHGGVSLPIYSYFNELKEETDYVKYMLKNCEVACYDPDDLKKSDL